MASRAKNLVMLFPVTNRELAPTYQQKLTLAAFLERFEGHAVRVELSKPVVVRSNNQNRYLWGVVYDYIATETGHTAEEIHAIMKTKFLPRKFVLLGKHETEIERSTTELSTDEFNLYLEKVRAFAASELGIRIPNPNE